MGSTSSKPEGDQQKEGNVAPCQYQASAEDDLETTPPADDSETTPLMDDSETGLPMHESAMTNLSSAFFINSAGVLQNGLVHMASCGASAMYWGMKIWKTDMRTWASKTRDYMAKRVSDAVQMLKDINVVELAKKGADWAKSNPKEASLSLACVLVPTLFGVLAPFMLGLAGFGASGITAGNSRYTWSNYEGAVADLS